MARDLFLMVVLPYIAVVSVLTLVQRNLPPSVFQNQVVRHEAVKKYLQPDVKSRIVEFYKREIAFWEKKLKTSPGNPLFLTKLAPAHRAIFRVTGEIEQLVQAEKYLETARRDFEEKYPDLKKGKAKLVPIIEGVVVQVYLGLAENALLWHEFERVEEYARKAFSLDSTRSGHAALGLIFDALINQGKWEEAKKILHALQKKPHRVRGQMTYLLRKSQYEAHLGNYTSAILPLQKALELTEHSRHPNPHCWLQCQIASLYRQMGEAEKGDLAYRKALDKDPGYYPALKGLANLALKEDGNIELAEEILAFLDKKGHFPDVLAQRLEIALYQKDKERGKELFQRLSSMASKAAYKGLYDPLLIEGYLWCKPQSKKLISLVEKWSRQEEKDHEKSHSHHHGGQKASHRHGPQFSPAILLAWCHFQQGRRKKALEIISNAKEREKTVVDQYYWARILAEMGNEKKARQLARRLIIHHGDQLGLLHKKHLRELLE